MAQMMAKVGSNRSHASGTVDDHEKEVLHYWVTDVVGEQLNASEENVKGQTANSLFLLSSRYNRDLINCRLSNLM